MIATHILATGSTVVAGGTNYTVIGIMLAIFVPVFGALAAILVNYFRLQRHRADAVAMAAYRKPARPGHCRWPAPGRSPYSPLRC
jgi:hypothetical protein